MSSGKREVMSSKKKKSFQISKQEGLHEIDHILNLYESCKVNKNNVQRVTVSKMKTVLIACWGCSLK